MASSQPILPPLDYPAIAELAAIPQWVLWRLVERSGKPTKVPFSARTRQAASVTDKSTWSTFNECCQVLTNDSSYNGLGFVFTAADPYCGVDLDHCVNPQTGEINKSAQDIVLSLDSYTEITPSGAGLHVLVKIDQKHRLGRRKNGLGIEVYNHDRYFTITGDHLDKTAESINQRDDKIIALLERFGLAENGAADGSVNTKPSDFSDIEKEIAPFVVAGAVLDEHRLVLALAERDFARIWRRQPLTAERKGWSASEWDMALCSMMINSGWSDADTVTAMIHYRAFHKEPEKLRLDYYAMTLGKCRNPGNANTRADEKIAEAVAGEMNGAAVPQILTGLSEIYGINFNNVIKYRSDPPQYEIRTEKGNLKGTIEMILEQRVFRAKFADSTGLIVDTAPKKKWQERGQAILNAAQPAELGAEATDKGQAIVWLQAYLAENGAPAKAKSVDVVKNGSSFYGEDGELYVNGSAMVEWIRIQKRVTITSTALGLKLREAGCESKNVSARVKGGGRQAIFNRSYWRVPPELGVAGAAASAEDEEEE